MFFVEESAFRSSIYSSPLFRRNARSIRTAAGLRFFANIIPAPTELISTSSTSNFRRFEKSTLSSTMSMHFLPPFVTCLGMEYSANGRTRNG